MTWIWGFHIIAYWIFFFLLFSYKFINAHCTFKEWCSLASSIFQDSLCFSAITSSTESSDHWYQWLYSSIAIVSHFSCNLSILRWPHTGLYVHVKCSCFFLWNADSCKKKGYFITLIPTVGIKNLLKKYTVTS